MSQTTYLFLEVYSIGLTHQLNQFPVFQYMEVETNKESHKNYTNISDL
jgi:hypothetical protein